MSFTSNPATISALNPGLTILPSLPSITYCQLLPLSADEALITWMLDWSISAPLSTIRNGHTVLEERSTGSENTSLSVSWTFAWFSFSRIATDVSLGAMPSLICFSAVFTTPLSLMNIVTLPLGAVVSGTTLSSSTSIASEPVITPVGFTIKLASPPVVESMTTSTLSSLTLFPSNSLPVNLMDIWSALELQFASSKSTVCGDGVVGLA